MAQYDAIGSLSEALSQHADHVLAKMTARQQQITRAMLTRLTERGSDKRDTRRPTRLDDVAASARRPNRRSLPSSNGFGCRAAASSRHRLPYP